MRRFTPDAAIIADAQGRHPRAARRGRKAGYKKTSGRRAAIREASAAALKEIQKIQPQMAYLNILREVLPHERHRHRRVVAGRLCLLVRLSGLRAAHLHQLGLSGHARLRAFPPRSAPRSRNPDRPVVAITGDGGFMFGVQELATAVQFNIGVVTLVFNNNAYGNVRRDQRERFDGRVVASDLVNPDFVKLAESFGVRRGARDVAGHFRPALEKALADGGPYLIDIEVPKDSEVSPWAFIHPAKP